MLKNTRMSRKSHALPMAPITPMAAVGPEIRGPETRDGTVLRSRATEFDAHSPAYPKVRPDPSEQNFPLTPPPLPSSIGLGGEARKKGPTTSSGAPQLKRHTKR